MKLHIKLLLLIMIMIISAKINYTYSQATQASNVRNPAWYLGWDGSNPINQGPLDILNNFQSQPVRIFNNNPITGLDQTLNIQQSAATGWPRLGIGVQNHLTNPVAHIHIGEDVATNSGYRTWMDIGMFINVSDYYTTHASTWFDNMYVGIKTVQNGIDTTDEETEAIINWGNNPSSQTNYTDRLRFVFTSAPSTTASPTFFKSGNLEGTEVSRMICDGNYGLMGIGSDNTNPGGVFTQNSYSTLSTTPPNPGNDPARTLEINTAAISATAPYYPGTSTLVIPHLRNNTLGYLAPNLTGGEGFSGLRFTDLTSLSVVSIDSSRGKVLSLNDDGDVILIQSNTTGFGAACPGPPYFDLPDDWRVGLGSDNLFFDNGIANPIPSETINSVIIGSTCPNTTQYAKLKVLQESSNEGTWGIYSRNVDPGALAFTNWLNWSIAVVGRADGTITPGDERENVGGAFFASGVFRNIGVKGYATSAPSGMSAIGGYFDASSPLADILLGNNPNSTNMGVYATAPVNPTSWAGVFQGNVNIYGNLYVSGTITSSDSIIKKDIDTISNALSILANLKPHTFKYKCNDYPYLNLDSTKQYGMIAQEIENFLPELISEKIIPAEIDTIGDTIHAALSLKALNYTGLIPITIQAVNELDSITTGISDRIDTLHLLSVANNGLSFSNDTVQLGGSPLIKYTEIPLNNNNLTFPDPATVTAGKNQVTIGGNTAYYAKTWVTDHPSKLAVFNPAEPNGAVIASFNNPSDVTNQTGLFVAHLGTRKSTQLTGVDIRVDSGTTTGTGHKNIGLNANITHSQAPTNIGIVSVVPDSSSTTNYGIKTNASGGTNNYGIWAEARKIGATGNYYAGYFNGDVYINNGTFSGNGYVSGSDSMFKTNINTISNAMNLIKQLKPKSFYFDTTNTYDIKLSGKKQYGFLAQNVQTVLPELVYNTHKPDEIDSAGNVLVPAVDYKSLNYQAFIAILVRGMQQQQASIDSMKIEIAELQHGNGHHDEEGEKSTSNNNDSTSRNIQYVVLKSEYSIVLNQNDPNPFAEETNITYYLPETVSKASIMFYDNTGKIFKSVELVGTGNGTLHVYASNLSAGLYMYSLVADGITIDTKKMVRTK